MARRRQTHTEESARRTYSRVTFDDRVIERTYAALTRPAQNQAYVDRIPKKTLDKIHLSLDAYCNKRKLGQRLGIPHNIIMYIWEHRDDS